MSILERSGEVLARLTDRRKFLKTTATLIFNLSATLAVSLDPNLSKSVYGCPVKNYDSDCTCSPLGAIYCEKIGHVCNGYKCPDGCSTFTGIWNTGCWCTKSCLSEKINRYYICCDCVCDQNPCGCKKSFVA